MVCAHGNLPLIRLGDHDVAGYGGRWLADAIDDTTADIEEFSEDIAAAVLFYLREVYEQNCVTVPQVESQLRSCLGAIGRDDVAREVALAPPPQHLALTEFAYRAGPGFDLAFFSQLAERLRFVRRSGARQLKCTGLAESISVLLRGTPRDRLGTRASLLANELISFISEALRGGQDGHPRSPIQLSIS